METNMTSTQNTFRMILGLMMIVAGTGHLTFARTTFQVQVPDWVPMDKDLVVVLSGYVEILLGLLLVVLKKYSIQMGLLLGVFYILVFPGNIAQYRNELNGFGLNTDTLRLLRLFFQPVLILWAVWSTGALHWLRNRT